MPDKIVVNCVSKQGCVSSLFLFISLVYIIYIIGSYLFKVKDSPQQVNNNNLTTNHKK